MARTRIITPPLPSQPSPKLTVTQNVRFSGSEHYDIILQALGGPYSPYGTLEKLHAITQGARDTPENREVPFTAAEEQLITSLELGGATSELASWTVGCIKDALIGEWAPEYWSKQGYCCYEMVWRTSMGELRVEDVAACAVHGRLSSSSEDTTYTTGSSSPGEAPESVNNVDGEEPSIVGVPTHGGGIVI